jgi:predicted amidohydrolase YtcJ
VTRSVLLRDVRHPAEDRRCDVLVEDDRVVDVAPTSALPVPAAAEVVALEGRVVLPGLWDHHVHATQWASARARVDVRTATSAAEAADLVRAAVSSPAFGGDVLVGHGMRHLWWHDEADPALLDRAAPGVAVVLQGVDLHTAWASTRALERIGRPVPPDGLLREGDCFHAIATLSDGSVEQQDAWVADAMAAAATRGIVGVHDFEFGDPVLDWQRRAARRPLDVRVAANVYPEALEVAVVRGWPTGHVVDGTAGRVRVGHLKLFVDGALNSRTALCHDPYPGGSPDDRGLLETPPDRLLALVRHAATVGLAPAIHAIGDRAVAVALDALDAAGGPGRVEHAQLVAPADVSRLAAPGRVVGVQPAHLLDDRETAEAHWAGRTARAFPLRDLLAAGARLELGSDAPVAPLDPWRGIVAATDRTEDDRPPWHPEQAIGVADALRATCGGRLRVAPGDVADLVVLDDDPLTCAPSTLRSPGVWGTMLAGRWTHRPG